MLNNEKYGEVKRFYTGHTEDGQIAMTEVLLLISLPVLFLAALFVLHMVGCTPQICH